MECFCYLRNIQDKLADRRSPYSRRFGNPFDGPVMPFEAALCFNPISTNEKSRVHQLCSKMLTEKCIGYTLNSGGGRTGDLIIAYWNDIENNVTSEVRVKTFKSKETGIKRLQNVIFCFFAQIVP